MVLFLFKRIKKVRLVYHLINPPRAIPDPSSNITVINNIRVNITVMINMN